MPQYQGVWTVEQQAQALTNQQWVTDPNFKNTTLLLQADGTGSGSQNQTFLDGSTNNFFITRNGNTTQGSFSPFSQAPGYWGNYFGGASDFLTGASNAALVFGTGTYTIEMWVYQTARSGTQFILGGGSGFQLGINSTGFLFGSVAGVGDLTAATIAIQTNAWTHIAVVRNSTSSGGVAYYINGAAAGTATDATNYTSNVTLNIGTTNGNAGVTPLSGYLSNLRVVKGTNVYTSAFAPSTVPLTAITNTSLLTCQNNRFVDNSTNALALSTSGSPSVQAFGPFAPALQWTPDVVGGSGYFDGTGDYLILPSSSAFALGTGQFCLEAWHYPTQNSAGGQILSTRTSGINQDSSFSLMQFTGTTYSMYANNNHVLTNMTPFQWNHVIVTRDASNTLRLILNGVLGNYEASYTSDITQTILTVGALNNGGETGFGYTTGHRITKGSIPTTYQTSSTTIGATIFTPPTQPVTLTSQGATSANVSYLSNYTNAGIYDGKMANNLETVGDAQVSTGTVKYGSGSIKFDGSGDYLYLPPNSTLAMGTGNFTIECWAYFNQIKLCALVDISTSVTAARLAFVLYASGYLALDSNASPVTTPAGTIVAGQWYHLALVRAGTGTNQTTIYVNGIARGTGTVANDFTFTSGKVGNAVDNQYMDGFIDDLRITKGVARYFTTFTPPQQALPRQ